MQFNIKSSQPLDKLIQILKAQDFAGMHEDAYETEESMRLTSMVESKIESSDSVLAIALKCLCNEPLDID